MAKRTRQGEGDQDPRVAATGGGQAGMAPAPQQAGGHMPPPPPQQAAGRGSGRGSSNGFGPREGTSTRGCATAESPRVPPRGRAVARSLFALGITWEGGRRNRTKQGVNAPGCAA